MMRPMVSRLAFPFARSVAACRFLSSNAAGQTSAHALTIQKMTTNEWSEAFKKVIPVVACTSSSRDVAECRQHVRRRLRAAAALASTRAFKLIV
jgi:hypothetical protein